MNSRCDVHVKAKPGFPEQKDAVKNLSYNEAELQELMLTPAGSGSRMDPWISVSMSIHPENMFPTISELDL